MGRLTLFGTSLPGVVVARALPQADARGSFTRWFCDEELAPVLGGARIVQINHSLTLPATTIRGLHFQHPPHAEIKMVRCIRGRVFDVAVDLRARSPTLRAWHGEELSADNGRMMIVPAGCAHGFQTLEDDCELLYLHTAPYTPAAEGGVAYDDPSLAIRWPLALRDAGLVSERDRALPRLAADFPGIAA